MEWVSQIVNLSLPQSNWVGLPLDQNAIYIPSPTCLWTPVICQIHFYPRPVLAFAWILSLPASVCLCVYQSRACPHDNSPLVQARITKFGTKVQKTLVKVPIVFGHDRFWPSRWNLTWKSNFTSFWACPPHNSSAVQARITKFGPQMHLSTVTIPINFGLDWFWSSLSFSILKPIFLPNLFAPFLYYIQWDPSLVNISETITGDRSNRFRLLTEQKFCRKLSRSISIDSGYCNRFINLGRPIFPLNHSGASAATVFTIPTTFSIAHAWCYTPAERATQPTTRVGSSLLDYFTLPSTHYVPKIVFTFSPICHACTNSIAIYFIIMRDLFLSASAHTSNPPFLLVGCHSLWWQAVEPSGTSLVIAQWLQHPTCSRKYVA